MDLEEAKAATLPHIDQETLDWLVTFCSWKRKKVERLDQFRIGYILDYMDTHAIDYYFITRNLGFLRTLLTAYSETYGEVEGIAKMIEDLTPLTQGRQGD